MRRTARGSEVFQLFRGERFPFPGWIDPSDPGVTMDWEKGMYHTRRADGGYLLLKNSQGRPVGLVSHPGSHLGVSDGKKYTQGFWYRPAPGSPEGVRVWRDYKQPRRMIRHILEALADYPEWTPVTGTFYTLLKEEKEKTWERRRDPSKEEFRDHPENYLTDREVSVAGRWAKILHRVYDRVIGNALSSAVSASRRSPSPEWDEYIEALQKAQRQQDLLWAFHYVNEALGSREWQLPAADMKVISSIRRMMDSRTGPTMRFDGLTTADVFDRARGAIDDYEEAMSNALAAYQANLEEKTSDVLPLRSASLRRRVIRLAYENPELRAKLVPLLRTRG